MNHERMMQAAAALSRGRLELSPMEALPPALRPASADEA